MDIKLLSFDIDNTLIKSEEDKDFFNLWSSLDFTDKPILVYNTGRLLDDTKRLIQASTLPQPDYIIAGVGTSIYDVANDTVLKEFSQILEEGWDRKKVSEIIQSLEYDMEMQPEHLQNNYKSSWFLEGATPDDIQKLERALEKGGLDINVVYSSSRHLDVLPKWANKGNSLNWLLKHLDIKAENTLVGGDSGNDSAMFKIPGINGVIVAHAQPELYKETKGLHVLCSEKSLSHAIIDALQHYGLEYTRSHHDAEGRPTDDTMVYPTMIEIEDISGITREQLHLIKEGYDEAVKVIKKNITPMGFVACSLDDNESVGTDENYRSVWARDGCIAITGTIPLVKDPEINECQRRTIETLVNNISPNGQIPSNVSIAHGRPDYSGVGGICAIDSGLWLIIAIHDYVKATRDIEFLRNNFAPLLRIMDWLSAQDGNNDALLEIPEAGDWTDLFGRSYNILYDEVLWYRTNICFGRLLEMLGNNEKAGDYLRWSQVIKREIMLNFWPTTQNKLSDNLTFAEQQYALGDARYLLAQVTPFDYSWRCDVYGNILAYLYDVVDKEKALHTFRFMWGAGVNDPFPVENVYPAVNAGDPDWRPYYTVNLLNLPHHYHNGGIWPFVGGGWVRYVNKLGMKNLAMQELFKLAELNKLGMFHEWEFNEWAHGKTGRPMGKAYQTWSASEYIKACHEVGIINKS
jgi:sucrose-6F-phosphate phosphohydrolase